MLTGEFSEFHLKEDQTDGIFEQLHLGVTLKIFFSKKISHAAYRRVIVSDLAKNGVCFPYVKIRECATPTSIPLKAFRIFSSRDYPASEVLTASGDSQRLRGVLV